MGATILDGAVIGSQCLVGANSLITQGVRIPDRSLVLGSPAKVMRALSAEELSNLKMAAQHYVENAAYCLKNAISVWPFRWPIDTRTSGEVGQASRASRLSAAVKPRQFEIVSRSVAPLTRQARRLSYAGSSIGR